MHGVDRFQYFAFERFEVAKSLGFCARRRRMKNGRILIKNRLNDNHHFILEVN